jgi:hypothetical protein
MRHFETIRTRYCGPTDNHPARVVAGFLSRWHEEDPGFLITPWAHDLDTIENHYAAALSLVQRFNAGREKVADPTLRTTRLRLAGFVVNLGNAYGFPYSVEAVRIGKEVAR